MRVMQGVPEQFPYKKDRAQFRRMPAVDGVELYHAHIDRYAFEPHAHDAYGIGIIDHGAERFRYRHAEHVASTGSLVLMHPDEVHTGQTATEGGWQYRMIYLDQTLLQHLSGDKAWWFTDVVKHQPETAACVAQLMQQLWQTHEELAAQSILFNMIEMLRPHARTACPETLGAPHRLDQVNQFLHAYYAADIGLDTLAQLVALSPYHFLRKYKAQYGVTPHQMLLAIRLNHAKRFLAQGIPAAQIAGMVGLVDQSHLSRTFVQRYGTTPGLYQQQILR